MNGRHGARAVADVIVGAPRFLIAPVIRPWHLRWGANDDEVAAAMPGDEIVPGASFSATRAITIDARPEDVWPWLVQLGFGRAGWYSYDLFDNAGKPSARQVLPQFQHPSVGDRVPMSRKVNDTTAFTLGAFQPNSWMLWEKPNSSWAWVLTPLANGQQTRLVTRLRQYYDWSGSPANAVLSLILFELGDFPMMRRLLLGVKERAETVRLQDRTRLNEGIDASHL